MPAAAAALGPSPNPGAPPTPIAFGHAVIGPEPLVIDDRIFGLDTGACHGMALTGVLIAGYTLVDGYAVKVLAMSPILIDYLGNLARIPFMLPGATDARRMTEVGIPTLPGPSTGEDSQPTTGEPLAVLRYHQSGLLAACFSPDGASVLTVASDTHACLWDLRGKLLGRPVAQLLGGVKSRSMPGFKAMPPPGLP